MEDVLEVDHRPYDPARPVVCMDESFKQLIGEVREPLPPGPGRVERYDSVYTRNSVASLFLAFEPLAGWREVKVTETRNRRVTDHLWVKWLARGHNLRGVVGSTGLDPTRLTDQRPDQSSRIESYTQRRSRAEARRVNHWHGAGVGCEDVIGADSAEPGR